MWYVYLVTKPSRLKEKNPVIVNSYLIIIDFSLHLADKH
jgi:hypothetical protein